MLKYGFGSQETSNTWTTKINPREYDIKDLYNLVKEQEWWNSL